MLLPLYLNLEQLLQVMNNTDKLVLTKGHADFLSFYLLSFSVQEPIQVRAHYL